ncbi:MAG: ferrous iron transport protein B [Oscillospiraceae bacterium]|nr:ferrous iron transport protein B [Oscillospiraceae bacterium]
MRIALVGNPNCGKTSLFNALTGARENVGNFPGITVEVTAGKLLGRDRVTIFDLPGIYALSPYSPEERLARDAISDLKIDAILNIVDGTNLQRNLYLTTQLLELRVPVVIAVNMIDTIRKRGDYLNLQALSNAFGAPAVGVSATKGIGFGELIREMVSPNKKLPNPLRFSDEVEAVLAEISNDRLIAIKTFNGDSGYPRTRLINEKIAAIEFKNDDEAAAILVAQRYAQIERLLKTGYKKSESRTPSHTVDAILTHRVFALPLFAAIMSLVYIFSVSTVGASLSALLTDGLFGDGMMVFGKVIPSLPSVALALLHVLNVRSWVISLVIDGVLRGVGTVVGFVPQMMLLFFCLSILESTGYLARIAFLLDGFFVRIGLTGQSFVPFLLSTGCGVPGVIATRTIESAAARRTTILTCTFLPCGAKIPVIALIAGVFFGGKWWVAASVYLIGIASVCVSSLLLQKLRVFGKKNRSFLLEIPPYHLPSPMNVIRDVWRHTASFLSRAASVIFLSAIAVWFLSNYALDKNGFRTAVFPDESILAAIASKLVFLFAPLGFTWQMVAATLTAFVAKENAVSTLAILFGFTSRASGYHALTAQCDAIGGYAFLIFNLLCAPCVAAMQAMRREMGKLRNALFCIAYQCLFAYAAALLIYQVGTFLRICFS